MRLADNEENHKGYPGKCITEHFTRNTTLLEELSECGGFLTSFKSNHVTDRIPGHVSGHLSSDLNTDNCTVELYHDLDKQHLSFQLGESSNTYHHSDKSDYSMSRDLESDDVPISSIWESRWLDHAAHVGRVMAQDKIQADTFSIQG